jgi:O-antigen biosynthesis protein
VTNPANLLFAEDGGSRTIYDEAHWVSLELLAVDALRTGDVAAAFKLADRCCRISPQPKALSYVLRGEAAFRMGKTAVAMSDISRALEIAPNNRAACRRMLAWGEGLPRRRAAEALIVNERDFEVLRRAINVLRSEGQRAFTKVTILDDVIEGWAVWEEDAPLEITVSDESDSSTVSFQPDSLHPLCGIGHSVGFRMPRAKSPTPQSILVSVSGQVFYSTRVSGNVGERATRHRRPHARALRDDRVTVVVPIYGDYEATRVCLESLLNELQKSTRRHAILVDDATPDVRIARHLAEIASNPRVDLLINERNLGFVGAVNHALRHIAEGDVILLNSDTVVPLGFIDRLSAAARLSSEIGTVTPFSNNGEFTSFPIPYTANPLGSLDEVTRIDRIAANINSGKAIDIPSGIGFCLYITRACLDAVGFLSEDFYRGYLEDVDFCLRAREFGFRNVCAPSVYVGHAGSTSFGWEKRSLVVRNLEVLERRFPRHRSECAAFMHADPLRLHRQAIELLATAPAGRPRLLVTGAGAVGVVALERARELASKDHSVLILEVRTGVSGPWVRVVDPAEGLPQSIQFDLLSATELNALVAYFRGVRPSRIELLDPSKVPFSLLNCLLTLQVPYDILIADGALLRRNGAVSFAANNGRTGSGFGRIKSRPCSDPEEETWLRRWHEVAQGAERILVPCEQAKAFAAALFTGRNIRKIKETGGVKRRDVVRQLGKAPHHVGLLPVRSCAEEQWLMRAIALAFKNSRPDVSLTIIGATINDSELMRIGNTYVTGPVDVGEFEDILIGYSVDILVAVVTRPLFGHPMLSLAFNSSRPMAYYDWTMGRVKARKRDLPLYLDLTQDATIDALDRWIPKP